MPLSLSTPYRFEGFELDPARRILERGHQIVPLSPKAFDVLTYLVQNPGRVITKEELLKAVWPASFVEEGNLAQHISSLRKAFADRANLIVTIPGRGYQFAARVQEPTAPEPEAEAASVPRDIPDPPAADILIQRVRERTHVVIEETSAPISRRPGIPRWAVWSVAAALSVAGCIVYAIHRFSPPPKLQRVMIADFLNTTGDPDFDRSLNTALAASLGQSPYIQLMSKGDVHSTLKLMEKALDTPMLGDTALEVCRRAGFEALLRARIAPDGTGYQLTMDEVNCETASVVATTRGKASGKDTVLNTLDALATSARLKLGESSQSIGKYDVPIGEATTFSFEALQAYTRGVDLGNAGKVPEALPWFRKAVELDPKFAMAVAGLGTAYYILFDGEQAGLYYKQAFALSANVSEAEKLYIRSNYYLMFIRDLPAARTIFEQETRTYPNDHSGWVSLANVDAQLGDYAAAVVAGEHALKIARARQEVDYEVLAQAYKRANRFAEAKRCIAAAQAQNLDGPRLHELLMDIAIVEQDREVIQREIAWTQSHSLLSRALGHQAIYEADLGHYARAESLFRGAIAQGDKDIDVNFARAMRNDEAGIELQAGRIQQARELLRQNEPDNSANFAVFAARAGNAAFTQRYLRLPMIYPHETVSLTLFRPEMEALLALHRNDPAAAIAALEISRPYELVHCEVIEIRGDAYLALKDGAHAQAEFQKLIDNPALEDPTLPRTFIAHVGLARAYALQHKTEDAKAEYQRFFSLWSDADNDIPILQQARAEYARL
jgi:DNA-binding winged helix-turn-helix (wHTH) protein/tetratricopeptide (TPR) repeat protein